MYFTSFGHKNVEQIRIPYWLTFIQLSLEVSLLNVHSNVLRCFLYYPIFHANCSPLITERWEKGSEKANKKYGHEKTGFQTRKPVFKGVCKCYERFSLPVVEAAEEVVPANDYCSIPLSGSGYAHLCVAIVIPIAYIDFPNVEIIRMRIRRCFFTFAVHIYLSLVPR